MEDFNRVRSSGETRQRYSREAHRRIGRQALLTKERGEMRANDQALAEFDDSGVRMSDFFGVYKAKKIRRDQEWTLERALQHAERGVERPEAAQFEEIFIQGINVGNWLGNLVPPGQEADFEAFAHKTALFDDFSHRADDTVELKFAKPLEGGGEKELSLEGIKLAFDVTTHPSRQVIHEKLVKSCNDSVSLPFGFTHLDYYENDGKRGPVKSLPRYTIGLSSYDIQDIWGKSNVDRRYGGEIRQMKPDLTTQFKVLTEIRAQNELFYAMMPDDASEELLLQLEATDECLHNALSKCTKEMVAQGKLPKAVREKIAAEHKQLAAAGAKDPTVRDRTIIEEYLLESSHAYFRTSKQKDGRYRRRSSSAKGDDDPFVQIVTEARALTKAAQQGELDKYRPIQPRNVVF